MTAAVVGPYLLATIVRGRVVFGVDEGRGEADDGVAVVDDAEVVE